LKLSDEEILAGCIKQQPAAQSALYQKYSAKLMAVCTRYAHTTFEAEDIFQDSFIKIFKNIGGYTGKGSLEGWVKHIVINTAINHFHSNKKHYYHDDPDNHFDLQNHDVDVLSEMTATEITALISQLAEGYRIIFNLFVVEGFNHAEIATMLNISEGTSKSQLSKAKQQLRKMITNLKHPHYVAG